MARCAFPYHVERKLYFAQEQRIVPVPCGKCPSCLKRRTASWSHRLEVESLRWPKAFFVTLTYDTEHVPLTKNTFMTLEPDHVSKFFKRLRKAAGKCTYYGCGEYGTRNKRPHYHLIILSNDGMFDFDIINAWYSPETRKPYGEVFFGDVEAGSIRYTVQYYDKGDWKREHQRDDRKPEFSRMSKGIGSSFLTEAMVKHFLANPDKSFIYDHEGRKIAIPRYYKRRIYDFVLSDTVVANNPSILIHLDEMADAKQTHHQAIKKVMESLPELEHTKELNAARQAEIINYRNSKRKTRT